MSNAHGPQRGPTRRGRRRLRSFALLAITSSCLMLGATMLPASAHADHHGPRPRNAFVQNNLVADQPGVATVQDPNLVNPWGLSAGPATPLWVSDNGTDKTTLYRGAVGGAPFSIVPLVVDIPGGAPTGQVFNGNGGFLLDTPNGKMPSVFLFASESGNITAWNPMLSPNTSAVIKASTPGAIYKGLAIATTQAGTFLYAADFHNNRIDVFDSNFQPVHRPFAFRDPFVPKGFAVFNVQTFDGKLYVTYAKQDDEAEDDVPGRGNGFVDVFSPEGKMLRRLVSRFALNSPGGLAIAPEGFGPFGGALLVGNFGDGKIHAFDPGNGHFLGTLRDAHHRALRIDGLWGLKFGNGVDADTNALIFSAGPDDEAHGLLGTIVAG